MTMQATAQEQAVWNAGAYARLSVDDNLEGPRGSIGNQLSIIDEYVGTHDDITLVDNYQDNGFSGGNFDRPGWQRLMSDVNCGRVNMVIVKDLSRMSRDHLGQARLLRETFPALGIRVVALNDGYDSAKRQGPEDFLRVPVTGLMNEMYLRDCSMKAKATLSTKRRQGKYVGAFAPYGYDKDPVDRNKLIINAETAPVVQDIYTWRMGGMSASVIADQLNEAGVPSPLEYSLSRGSYRASTFRKRERAQWEPRAIIRILADEIYTGTMVQGRTCKPSFKSKKVLRQDPSDWVRVPGTHEAIVDHGTFEAVQRISERDMRVSPDSKTVLPLSGYVFCAECGATMARRTVHNKGGDRHHYTCETHRKDRNNCSQHKVSEEALFGTVADAVRNLVDLAVDVEAAEKSASGVRRDRGAALQKRLRGVEEQVERYKGLRRRLYADYADGVIDRDEYDDFSRSYDARLADLNREASGLREDVARIEGDQCESWCDTLLRYRDFQEIDRVMVVELLDRVLVHEDGRIEVVMRFGNPFSEGGEAA